MTTGGSQQLRIFRRAIRAGKTMHSAAVEAGISLGEARLVAAEDLKNPPPPEAFELLNTAPVVAQTKENDDMALQDPGTDDDEVIEIKKIDFERAIRVMQHDIAPTEETLASERGDLSAAWKIIEDECHCNKAAAKAFAKLRKMSDELRDDYLRTLYGLMKADNLGISRDLVDRMGDGDVPTMPVIDPTPADLHTIQ